MNVAVASDHAGFHLKAQVVTWLRDQGHQVADLGPETDARCDYPDFARAVARRVSSQQADRGVLVCGSGLGMAITANRESAVRAVVASSELDARLARQHNDANILCLGERMTTPMVAEALLQVFFVTPFEGGRHQARVEKIDGL